MSVSVLEWDASSHGYAYDLWEKAILSDGGELCRKRIESTGEPLVEGMLVGTSEHILTTAETHQVNWISFTCRTISSSRSQCTDKLRVPSSLPTNICTRVHIWSGGHLPASML